MTRFKVLLLVRSRYKFEIVSILLYSRSTFFLPYIFYIYIYTYIRITTFQTPSTPLTVEWTLWWLPFFLIKPKRAFQYPIQVPMERTSSSSSCPITEVLLAPRIDYLPFFSNKGFFRLKCIRLISGAKRADREIEVSTDISFSL